MTGCILLSVQRIIIVRNVVCLILSRTILHCDIRLCIRLLISIYDVFVNSWRGQRMLRWVLSKVSMSLQTKCVDVVKFLAWNEKLQVQGSISIFCQGKIFIQFFMHNCLVFLFFYYVSRTNINLI